jgi:hypothetical protein
MALDETTMERLAFNKHLVDLGVEQAQEPQPMASTAVLSFHDAVELFLQHATEYMNINKGGKSHIHFMEYWEIIGNKLPHGQELGQKPAMRRLNEARVNLKHQGTRPDTADIESFGVAVRDFFEENTPKVFGIDYSEISLINLVEYESTRKKLTQAREYLADGQRQKAIKKIAVSYEELFSEYNQRMKTEVGYQPFSIGLSQGFPPNRINTTTAHEKDIEEITNRVNNVIESTEKAVRVLSLGMDYRRYSRFDYLTPPVLWDAAGDFHIPSLEETEFSEEEVEFCINFVVETAIQLQKRDVI